MHHEDWLRWLDTNIQELSARDLKWLEPILLALETPLRLLDRLCPFVPDLVKTLKEEHCTLFQLLSGLAPESLIAAIKKDFLGAQMFQTLIDRYMPEMRRWLTAKSIDAHEIDDIIQVVTFNLWRNGFRNFDTARMTFLAYLAKCVNNHFVATKRPKKPETGKTDLSEKADPRVGPTEIILLQELEIFLEGAISQLPTNEQNVLRASLKDLGRKEIAESLGLPLGQVDHFLYNARQKIHKAVCKHQGEPSSETKFHSPQGRSASNR